MHEQQLHAKDEKWKIMHNTTINNMINRLPTDHWHRGQDHKCEKKVSSSGRFCKLNNVPNIWLCLNSGPAQLQARTNRTPIPNHNNPNLNHNHKPNSTNPKLTLPMVRLGFRLRAKQDFFQPKVSWYFYLTYKVYLCLYSIGSQEHSCLWWTIYVSIQYRLLDLKKEQPLRNFLNYFRNILGKKLDQK